MTNAYGDEWRPWRRGLAVASIGVLSMVAGEGTVHAGFDEPRIDPGGNSALDDAEEPSNVSLALRLESAEVFDVEVDDDEREFIAYTFVEPLDDVLDENRFLLIGRDPADIQAAETVFRDEDDPRRVFAGFEAGTDVSSFVLAAVTTGAVAELSGEENVRSATPLVGGAAALAPGRTTGPDLVEVRARPNLERADFIFDENLLEDPIVDARDFGYFTMNGSVARSDELISLEDNVATVRFDEEDGDQVEEAVRFFVLHGAVEDQQGNDSPLRVFGEQTTVPDLVAVEAVEVGSTRFDFTFDGPVTDAVADRFGVYTPDGTGIAADAVTRPTSDTVRVAFPETEDFGDAITLAAVLPGAVVADDASGAGNTVGAVPVDSGGAAGAGPTLGPDLVTVNVDLETGQVVFVFDEALDDDMVLTEDDFALVTDSGLLVPARQVIESVDDFVVVLFDAPMLAAAVGVTIPTGAVRDFIGNPNPLATLRL